MTVNTWNNLRQGRPCQTREARELHRQAGVPEGPCGVPELNKFQVALAPHYQIIVLSMVHPFLTIFKGPPAPHVIRLIKGNDHFHGCTSFPGFTDHAHYCEVCDRGITRRMLHIIRVKGGYVNPVTAKPVRIIG